MIISKIVLIITLLLASSLLIFINYHPEIKPGISRQSHPVLFYDQKSFLDGIEISKKSDITVTPEIKGGIIPHHLLPGFILSDFFSRLPKTITTVILLGPNHYELGNNKMLTSTYNWQTPFGLVEPNDQIVNELVVQKIIYTDESVLEKEHSISGITPYVKYYLPNAKLAPIILKRSQNSQDLENLSDKLANYIKDPNTILIAAVDFSHYQTSNEAKERNKQTLKAIEDFDYPSLMSFDNSNCDSPPSIVVLLKSMQKIGKTNVNVLFDTNSGEILNETSNVTSYFSIIF